MLFQLPAKLSHMPTINTKNNPHAMLLKHSSLSLLHCYHDTEVLGVICEETTPNMTIMRLGTHAIEAHGDTCEGSASAAEKTQLADPTPQQETRVRKPLHPVSMWRGAKFFPRCMGSGSVRHRASNVFFFLSATKNLQAGSFQHNISHVTQKDIM